MRYNFDNISAFLQVVESGSISAAALRLNLAKSVVSKRITHLEEQLGVELLYRSTRGVVPTDEGLAFHKRARDIMQQLDTAADELIDRGDCLCGQLRITAPMSFGTLYLGPLLFPLLSKHPRLGVAVNYDDRFADLVGEGYDLAVRIGRLQDSSLIARKLAPSRRIVCCSPDYARRTGLPATLEEIPDHTCIGYANVHSSQIWQFEPDSPGGEIRSLVIRSRIVLNNGEAMRDAAIAGLGLVLLPRFIAAQALVNGQLIPACPDVHPVSDTIHAVYPRTHHVARKVRAVIDHLIAALAGQPPWDRAIKKAKGRPAG